MLTRQQKRKQKRMAQNNQSSNVESNVYAMCIIHNDEYGERSALDLDKFIEIAQDVSQLAITNVNIKHFLSER